MTKPLLSISGLYKKYAMPVLSDVDFALAAGEVHALVGANGAGKTTLCNVICGLTPSDVGDMAIEGDPYSPSSIRDSEAAGIHVVMQELNLISSLSIGENLFFSSLPNRNGIVDFQRLFDESRDLLNSFGLTNLDPR